MRAMYVPDPHDKITVTNDPNSPKLELTIPSINCDEASQYMPHYAESGNAGMVLMLLQHFDDSNKVHEASCPIHSATTVEAVRHYWQQLV
jgi:hypothetical protein